MLASLLAQPCNDTVFAAGGDTSSVFFRLVGCVLLAFASGLGIRPTQHWILGDIAELSPQLVTFNGQTFDLPVLRYRAMVHKVPAIGLSARSYFNRYTDDAIDLCDVLSSYSSQAKAKLHELCRVMGLPGKPDGIDGGEVEKYFHDGRIQDVANYCETDVVNTYRVWLRHELFRGKLTNVAYDASESNLSEFIRVRSNTKPHLVELGGSFSE